MTPGLINLMKRARPQGISSAAKKEKPEEEPSSYEIENKDSNQEEKTGKLVYELPEDATALDQVRALFESAVMFLDDINKSKPVFNGVIHECLRLEAILESDTAPETNDEDENDVDSFVEVKKSAEKIFGPEFYYIFGESLRTLAEFEMGEEIEESSIEQVRGLLSASIDRFQMALDKLNGDESNNFAFKLDLDNALMYSMASLCILIEENDVLSKDLLSLAGSEPKEIVSTAMFDAVEFFCQFIETAYEQDFDIEGLESFGDVLIKNLSIIEQIVGCSKKLKLTKVDVPLRLSVIRSEEIEGEKSEKFLVDLEEILAGNPDLSTRYEALQLKASIKEILGADEEANEIYEEAENIQVEDNSQ